jgi:hypothetical protein
LLPLSVRNSSCTVPDDGNVPFTLGPRYAAAGDPCELLVLPGIEHFALIDPHSRAWPRSSTGWTAGCEDDPMSGGSLPEGTVTFMFSDIERSTELVRHVGDGACARLGALAEPG